MRLTAVSLRTTVPTSWALCNAGAAFPRPQRTHMCCNRCNRVSMALLLFLCTPWQLCIAPKAAADSGSGLAPAAAPQAVRPAQRQNWKVSSDKPLTVCFHNTGSFGSSCRGVADPDLLNSNAFTCFDGSKFCGFTVDVWRCAVQTACFFHKLCAEQQATLCFPEPVSRSARR